MTRCMCLVCLLAILSCNSEDASVPLIGGISSNLSPEQLKEIVRADAKSWRTIEDMKLPESDFRTGAMGSGLSLSHRNRAASLFS